MIEERLGHKTDVISGEEIVELQGIYNSLKEGHGKRGDFFTFPKDKEEEPQKPSGLMEKLKKKAEQVAAVVDDTIQ